jgi:replicative DNA helicase
MKRIVFTALGQRNEEYKEVLEQLLLEHENYNLNYKIDILTKKEVDFLKFIVKTYENSKEMPSLSLFTNNFPEVTGTLDNIPAIPLDDYRVYSMNFISKRVNKNITKNLQTINAEIEQDGVTEDLMERFTRWNKISNLNKRKKVVIKQDLKTLYLERKGKPPGMKLGIKALDDIVGGLTPGTLNTIAGYTSHFKTTFALNICYRNAYLYNYNTVYFSLETSKEDMLFNLMCRHSKDPKFTKYHSIPHDKMRMGRLTEEEEAYLYDVIEKDLESEVYSEKQQKNIPRGKVIILDETDFMSFSFSEIYNTLEEIDKQLDGNLDAFVVDYVQLTKFSDTTGKTDDNRIVNSFVTFFRRLTQKFGTRKNRKKLIGILLSQINRESWKRAAKRDGMYDLTCLADANELERGSYRVFTSWTSEDMKTAREAKVQLLKNRGGATQWNPIPTYASGEEYMFGDEDSNVYTGNLVCGASGGTDLAESDLGKDFNDDFKDSFSF